MIAASAQRRSASIAVAAVFLCLGAVFPSAASATYRHVFSSDFGVGNPPGPGRMTLDQATGHVYIANQGAGGGVYNFEPSGELDPTTPQLTGVNLPVPDGVGIDESTQPTAGNIYVADYSLGEVFRFNSAGEATGSPTPESPLITKTDIPPQYRGNGSWGLVGLAVDASGNIYVGDAFNQVVDEFTSSGTFVAQFGAGVLSEIQELAIGPNGNLYVANYPNLVEFEPSGQCVNHCASVLPVEATRSVAFDGHGDIYVNESSRISEFDPSGELVDRFGSGRLSLAIGVAVRVSTQVVYVSDLFAGDDHIFTPIVVPNVDVGPPTNPGSTSVTLNGQVSAAEVGEEVTECHFEYGTDTTYGQSLACLDNANAEVGTGANPITSAAPVQVHADLSGLTSETTYHYHLLATGAHGSSSGADHEYLPHAVAGLETEPPTGLNPTGVTLHGSFIGNGEDTHYYFQWGPQGTLANMTPEPPADAHSPTGPARTGVSTDLADLSPVTSYEYRVVAENGHGTSFGGVERFSTPPSAPLLAVESVGKVHADSALLHARINPGGGDTTYHFEYGLEQCSTHPGSCANTTVTDIGAGTAYRDLSAQLSQLTPSTRYYYRVVAENATGTLEGPDRDFITFPEGGVLADACPNAHVRQQTAAALLPDCRAYELVSAASSGGYGVESTLVPNQSPYPGYPDAVQPSRVLYAVHDGGIPSTDHPTNKGPDPYVATRGEAGWKTEYVGIPADDPYSASPFSSTPTAASAGLEAFAFGGPGGCSPCFAGGYTGIPVRLPSGELVQGMAGSLDPGPSAAPAGYIARPLSADGSHLVFGSTSRFEPDGNSGGAVSIYDRNLQTDMTHVVSKLPNGENIPPLPLPPGYRTPCAPGCQSDDGIAELDISRDGSRILIGQAISTDSAGNNYYHLYLNVGDSSKTIDLTPGTTHGVLFDGMTADGSKVFFTTADALTTTANQDLDESADLYEAEIVEEGGEAKVALTRLSVGEAGAGNTDSCNPVARIPGHGEGEPWNTLGPEANCGVVAIGGGGGVASGDGSIYFLSPERLTSCNCAEPLLDPVSDQPNLYLARPGQPLGFIATLRPDDQLVRDAVSEPDIRKTADFQVTPSGDFAAFATVRPLEEGYENAGYSEVYRYSASAGQLTCVSCNPTNAEALGSSRLASRGLSLTSDGRVFFDSADALVPRDLDEKQDAYEWEETGRGGCERAPGCVGLISTGTSPFSSGILGVSSDGVDAYFFTRDTLVPLDENGELAKIYDARELGGFPFEPPPPPCKASDECHGPGSPPPPPLASKSTAIAGQGNTSGTTKKKHHRRPHHRHRRRSHRHG
jgi:hypothetical protein